MIVEWTGPAWAAPEFAERLRTGTEVSAPTRERWMFGVLCAALQQQLISADAFRDTISLGSTRS